MSLTLQRLQIKKLNDRLLNQNILIQTLMDVILESGIVTEKELENRLDSNLKKANDLLESFEKEHSIEVEEEVMEGIVLWSCWGLLKKPKKTWIYRIFFVYLHSKLVKEYPYEKTNINSNHINDCNN